MMPNNTIFRVAWTTDFYQSDGSTTFKNLGLETWVTFDAPLNLIQVSRRSVFCHYYNHAYIHL